MIQSVSGRAFAIVMALSAPLHAAEYITVASTTSTENSGLFGHILPLFTAKSGVEVRVIAQGTGQALETAKRGDADVVFVHARAAEDRFVSDGYGLKRYDVMFNDFVLVGPSGDVAGLKQVENAADAFAKIAETGAGFASRGDDSGTHKAERRLWDSAGVEPAGAWYMETGSGMGATLNVATQAQAYALTDRGTWISFLNKGDLSIVFEGDDALLNPYGVILVNPERHPHVRAEEGQAFIDWLISDEAQAAIAAYRIDGQQLFFPNADRP